MSAEQEREIVNAMLVLGVSRIRAEFIVSVNRGDIRSDVVFIDDTTGKEIMVVRDEKVSE